MYRRLLSVLCDRRTPPARTALRSWKKCTNRVIPPRGPHCRRSARRCALVEGHSLASACSAALINVLMLTGSFFMLLVYDRVLPSRSISTLVVLGILALGLFAAQGVLDLIRSRLLVRIGASLHEALGRRVYTAIVRSQLRVGSKEGNQPLRISTPSLVSFRGRADRPIRLALDASLSGKAVLAIGA